MGRGSIASGGMEDIAVLGLGHMGAAIAGRLAEAGFRVTGWNRSPKPQIPGVTQVTELSGIRATTIITMLTDGAAVQEVLGRLGPRAGTVVVDMSTIGPEAVRRIRAG